MNTLSIRIRNETVARLTAMARANQQTVEALVESLIEDFTDTDETRLAEYENTGHAIRHDIAAAWLKDLARGEYRPCPE